MKGILKRLVAALLCVISAFCLFAFAACENETPDAGNGGSQVESPDGDETGGDENDGGGTEGGDEEDGGVLGGNGDLELPPVPLP